jgi:hypothetical protein
MDLLRILSGTRWLVIAVAVLVVAGLTAVVLVVPDSPSAPGHRAGQGRHEISTRSVISTDQRVSSTSTTGTGTISIFPAPTGDNPAVSQEVALQAWLATGLAPPKVPESGSATQPTSVLFGMMSDTTMATLQPNGSTKPKYTHALVWVVSYRQAEVAIIGAPTHEGQNDQNKPARMSVGTFTAFINATTGKYEFASSTTFPVTTGI